MLGKENQTQKKIQIYYSPIENIHFNLAIEEYLFTKPSFKNQTLYLWRNAKTIVIGKHQNPWRECQIEQMIIDGIQLARRRTGGSAVFQDLGNTCFSFLSPMDAKESAIECKNRNNKILMNSLEKLGVKNIDIEGSNNITVDKKKVSGSAYQVKVGDNPRSLHHGTMMMNVNFNALENYLEVNKEKLVSKGADSVKSRVMNLQDLYKDINHNTLCKALQDEFTKYYSPCDVEVVNLDHAYLENNKEIQRIYNELKSKDWIFFNTKKFTNTHFNRFSWGSIEFNVLIEAGKINYGRIFSDCLYPDFIDKMNEILQLKKIEYTQEGIKNFASLLKKDISKDEPFFKFIEDVEAWLIKSI